MVELHGPVLFGSFAAITIFLNASQILEMDNIVHNYQQGLSTLYYLLYIGIVSPQFLSHFLIRSVIFGFTKFSVAYSRVVANETEPTAALFLNIAGWLLAEIIFYVQAKAQAKLFLASKVTAMQQ